MNIHSIFLFCLLVFSSCSSSTLLPLSIGDNPKKSTVAISGGVKDDMLKFAIQDYLLNGTKECMMEVNSFKDHELDSINQRIDSLYKSGSYWQRAVYGPKKYHQAFAQISGVDHSIIFKYVLGQADTIETLELKEQDPTLIEWLLGMEKRVGWEPSYMLVRPLRKIKIAYIDNHTGKKLWKMKKSVGPFTRRGNPKKLEKRAFDKFTRKFPYCSVEQTASTQ